LHDGAREPQPRGAVVRRRRYDLPEKRHAVAEIVAREGGVGVAADLRERLRRRARIRLDLRFQRDRAVGEIAILERLVGGIRRQAGNSHERGGKAGANERKHW